MKITLGLRWVVIIATVLSTSLSRAVGPHGTQVGWAIDDSGNVLITDAVADRLAQSGAGWVRLEFRRGPYNGDTPTFYAKYDEIVNRLRARGLQIIGNITYSTWPGSQAAWHANNWENTGGDGYNTYIDQFGYCFGRMASHWQGKIRYWEIWNEPNCYETSPAPGQFVGGFYIYPSNFAAMLTHCHSQVHYYGNLDVQIISGGLLGHNIAGYNYESSGAQYLYDTYNVGINHTGKFAWTMGTYGQYPLDAIGQHFYIDQGGPVNTSWLGTYLDWVHNVVTAWEGGGSQKKTWVTEFGWETRVGGISESTQNSNLNAAFNVMNGKSYIKSAIQFQFDDNPAGNLYFGLFRSNLTKKPAWTTFSTKNTYQGKRSNGATVTAILNYFNNTGGAATWGSPYDNGGTAWAHWWDYGYVQDFDGGSIGRGAIFDTGRSVIRGFWSVYLNYHTYLRFPVTDEYAWGAGTRQDFQGGYMTWDPANGVVVH
jgi:hypothetical protein